MNLSCGDSCLMFYARKQRYRTKKRLKYHIIFSPLRQLDRKMLLNASRSWQWYHCRYSVIILPLHSQHSVIKVSLDYLQVPDYSKHPWLWEVDTVPNYGATSGDSHQATTWWHQIGNGDYLSQTWFLTLISWPKLKLKSNSTSSILRKWSSHVPG